MRRNRIIWLCLWVLSIVGISFKGGAVTYGLFALLTLVPVVSALYLLAVYMLFHIYQDLGQRFVSVNEPADYRFALVNEYPLRFAGIKVSFFTEFSTITDLDSDTEYELAPHTRTEKETKLICRYRGEYNIGIKEIEIQDHFRLFRLRYKNKECIHATVKPQLVKTDRIGSIELSDAVKESERGRSELDIISREYVPGDDRRFINWSQSVRTGNLMTRELTGSDHREAAVIIDTFRYSADQADFLPAENKILETALAAAYYFCRNNIPVSEYHIAGELVRLAAESTLRFEEFYECVSETVFDSRNDHTRLYDAVTRCPEIFDSSMVFIILSVWDALTDALLKQLEAGGLYTVICFIGDNENDCPDLSDHKSCGLVMISPYEELAKEAGE
ncbi:MAG: DUF58 domain-containing protein [Ruminiclostridium sp.]|nr:DUF58 domain-containing protein [Ruminiclostridium sp.]